MRQNAQSSPSTPPQPSGNLRYLLLSLHLPAVGMGLGVGMTNPILAELAKSFDVSAGLATLLFIVQMAGAVVATVPTGYLVDRVGRKPVMLAGPVLIAVSSLLIVRAESFPELLAYRFLAGWGQQMWMLSRLSMIADVGAARQRGTQITSMFGVQRIGTLLGPLMGGLAATHFGLDVPFVLNAIVILLLGVVPAALVVKETAIPGSGRPPAGAAGQPERTSSWRVYLKPPLPQIFSAQFLTNIARGGIEGGGVLYIYAAYAYDADTTTIGALASAVAMIGLPLTFAAGFIMDRRGRKYTVVPGSLLLSVAMVFMALTALLGLNFQAFVVAFFGVHLAASLLSGSMQTIGTDVAPESARGTFFGVSRFVAQTGRLSSPTSFALLAELASYGVAFSFFAGSALCSGLIIAFAVRETLHRSDRVTGVTQ